MKTLPISPKLSLPIDAATQTFAFIARKGGGKTYAAGKLAECLLDAGVQVVILDAVGNWWGLRLMADGRTPAYDIPVLGGLRGDIPLESSGGHLIADIVVDSGRSIILDISQFSKTDRQRFATGFAERLWRQKKAERHPSPLHLIIEESQLIVPQMVKGDQAVMVGIYEEIIRLGRNYGIGISMISQRPQSVNKEVLNQTECLFVFQVNGKQERHALRDWIAYHGAQNSLVDELPSLAVGTAYVWSPQWLQILQKVPIGEKKTFDASATPRVGVTQIRRELKALDLDDLKKRMAATIEKAMADNPRELRAEIARLQKQLRLKNDLKSVNADVKVVAQAVANATRELQREIRGRDQTIRELNSRLEKIAAMCEGSGVSERRHSHLQPAMIKAGEVLQAGNAALKRALRDPATVLCRPPIDSDNDFRPSGTQQRILDALAWFESIGNPRPTNLQVGAIALIDSTGGHFSNVVGPLSSNGLVERGAGAMALTEQGRAIASVPEQIATLEDYHKVLRERVRRARSAGGKTIEMLNAIIARGGSEITNEEIGAAVGIDHTGGHFSNMIGPLGTVGLIERRSGIVRPTEVLFPPGLV